MGRMIDADALIAQMESDAEQMEDQIAIMFTYAAINDVKHAPTIEERKTGTWIEIGTITHSYKCSVCGRMLVSIADGKNKVVEHYPFCHCGAKMEGEQS